MLQSLRFKRLKFMSAVSFMITITTFCYWYYVPMGELDLFARAGLFTDCYFCIGLAGTKLMEMKILFSQSHVILATNLTDDEKLKQIRSFVARVTEQWARYFKLWEDISNGKEPSRFNYFKELPIRIVKGNITVGQFAWIFLNFVYTIIATSDVINVPAPIDFVISAGIFACVLFSSGTIAGMGSVISAFMTALMPKTKEQIRAYLDNLEIIINDAMDDYYTVTLKQDIVTTTNHKK